MNEKLNKIIQGIPFSLNDKQLAFLQHFTRSDGHSVLTAAAGGGKSTMMSLLKSYYGNEIVFFGATGVSSQNLPDDISCGTAHSNLSLPLKPSTELNHRRVGEKTRNLFGTSDLVKIVVIDEAFVFNSDNLDMIYRRLERFNKRTPKRGKRDIRLLLVGDVLQATPIVSEEDGTRQELVSRWDHHLMFRSSVWNRFNFTYYVLDKVERQEDKVFKAALDVIRYNQVGRLDKCLEWLNRRVSYDYDTDSLILAATNKVVDSVNQRVLEANPNRKVHYKPVIKGKFNIRDTLVREQGVTLCKGLKVMTIINDPQNRWINGSTGFVTELDNEGCFIRFEHSGEEHYVEMCRMEDKETYVEKDVVQPDESVKDELKEKVVGSMVCMGVLQASALTIMKSQGLTISEKYVIEPQESWYYNWDRMRDFGTNFIYLSLSRGTDINNITLARPLTRAHIKGCQDSINFWFECKEKSVI